MKVLDEKVRLKVSQAYCNLRSRSKTHMEAVSTIEHELLSAGMGSVSLQQLIAYKSAVAPYCAALRKKVEGR